MAAEIPTAAQERGKQRCYRVIQSNISLPVSDAQQRRREGILKKGPGKRKSSTQEGLRRSGPVCLLSPCLHILTHPTHSLHCSEVADKSKTLKEPSSTRRQNTD